jgi:hypothetical protein
MKVTVQPGPVEAGYDHPDEEFVKRFTWLGEWPSFGDKIDIAGVDQEVIGFRTVTITPNETHMFTMRLFPGNDNMESGYQVFVWRLDSSSRDLHYVEYLGSSWLADLLPSVKVER